MKNEMNIHVFLIVLFTLSIGLGCALFKSGRLQVPLITAEGKLSANETVDIPDQKALDKFVEDFAKVKGYEQPDIETEKKSAFIWLILMGLCAGASIIVFFFGYMSGWNKRLLGAGALLWIFAIVCMSMANLAEHTYITLAIGALFVFCLVGYLMRDCDLFNPSKKEPPKKSNTNVTKQPGKNKALG